MERTYENGRWYHRGGRWLLVDDDGRRFSAQRRPWVTAYSEGAWSWDVVDADGTAIASGTATYVAGARDAARSWNAPWMIDAYTADGRLAQ